MYTQKYFSYFVILYVNIFTKKILWFILSDYFLVFLKTCPFIVDLKFR